MISFNATEIHVYIQDLIKIRYSGKDKKNNQGKRKKQVLPSEACNSGRM